ncbi:hypothetical protein [Kitasatospora sp. NPDC087315]|uniref:hypothetical protein n=1 Tax=Kitasatospora sp. NPDC087315 TaxID=3364069 RepID=UPI0037F79473
MEYIQELESALSETGVVEGVHPNTRRALWGHFLTGQLALSATLTHALGLAICLLAPIPAMAAVGYLFPPAIADLAKQTVRMFAIMGLLYFPLGALLAAPLASLNRDSSFRFGRRYLLVHNVTEVAIQASKVTARPTEAEAVLELSRRIRRCEESILRAHRTRGTVIFRSHRRPELRKHARTVVARLRQAETGLDTDLNVATREIVRLLCEVSDNYLADAGRLGRLLPPETELKDLEPVRDYAELKSALRYAAGIAVFGVSAWGSDRLGIPAPYNFAVAAIPTVLLVPSVGRPLLDAVTSKVGGP